MNVRKTALFTDATLKALYEFDAGALTTDSKGSHTLTAIGSPTEVVGLYNGAVGLARASSQGYSATDGADFKPTGNYCFFSWLKTSLAGGYLAQSCQLGATYGGWYVSIGGAGKIQFGHMRNTGTTFHTDWEVINSANAVNDGEWHLIVCGWDGSNLQMYIDGVQQTPVSWATAAGYAATNYVRIGCENDAGSDANFLDGYMDDTGFVNGKMLSSTEVQTLLDSTVNYIKFYRRTRFPGSITGV